MSIKRKSLKINLSSPSPDLRDFRSYTFSFLQENLIHFRVNALLIVCKEFKFYIYVSKLNEIQNIFCIDTFSLIHTNISELTLNIY